jgi:hypothetical protein
MSAPFAMASRGLRNVVIAAAVITGAIGIGWLVSQMVIFMYVIWLLVSGP